MPFTGRCDPVFRLMPERQRSSPLSPCIASAIIGQSSDAAACEPRYACSYVPFHDDPMHASLLMCIEVSARIRQEFIDRIQDVPGGGLPSPSTLPPSATR